MYRGLDILNSPILIVDDNELQTRDLESLLREQGYRGIMHTQDIQAVEGLQREYKYELILLHWHMANGAAAQLLQVMQEIDVDEQPPVLAMVTHMEDAAVAWTAGAKDCVTLPLMRAEMRTRVHNLLEARLLYKKLEHYNQALASLALHDGLTGLPNRRLLMDRIALSIAHARRSKSTMAVLCLDLDGFTQINDTLGREAGDTLLRMVAGRLVAAVRQEDTVARVGDDEFVISLWQLNSADGVEKLVTKIISAVSQPYSVHSRTLNVSISVSVGVGVYPTHGEDADTLMKSADLALFDAKRSGKNAYRISERTGLTSIARH